MALFDLLCYSRRPVWGISSFGMLRPDGCLVHCGRKDFQMKIRGQRVDLAEVEAALLDLVGIKDAVIMAPEK